MELVVIFNIVLLIYVLSMRKKAVCQINNTTRQLTDIYNRLSDIQHHNYLIADTFQRESKNKIYELSLILMNIKTHYEEILEITSEYLDPDLCAELEKNIKAVDNQLKEIGFINNKVKVSTSLITDLHFIKGSEFCKN